MHPIPTRLRLVHTNHDNPVWLEDLTSLLGHLLEAGGCRLEIDSQFLVPGFCHIVVEHFTTGMAQTLCEVVDKGSELIVVATEILEGTTFNPFVAGQGGDKY